jgi:hypothetical protein
MLRSLVLITIFAACASAAIWPERLGSYERKSVKQTQVTSDENGREAAEDADYGSFQVTATRYKDSTGAYAAWLESSGKAIQVGNYVVTCSGKCPKNLAELADSGLPAVSHAPLPILGNYLPSRNQIPHSERYILGPQSLKQNAPQIPESAVAFQFGTEGETAHYRILQNEATVALFSYPTPQIARGQVPQFQAIPGAAVKRTGPLVAVFLGASDPAEANTVLGQINYQASVTMNEPLPLVLTPQSTAQMILAIISLAGIVLAFCLVSGLLFGALRVIGRKFGYTDAGIAMTTLHLSDK